MKTADPAMAQPVNPTPCAPASTAWPNAVAVGAAAAVVDADQAVVAAAVGRTALVAGATGLVGQEILGVLLADKGYAAVHCVGRRALTLRHPKLQSHCIDFSAPVVLPAADDVYIALGTTIKVAGSQPAFRAVDLDAVVAVARAAQAAGATRLGVVSAMGADSHSAIFYNRIKGEMEQAVRAMGFHRVVIARPSMLAGDRESLKQAARLGERLGLAVMSTLRPLIPVNYQAISARDVALSLVAAVKHGVDGVQVLPSGQLQRRIRRERTR